MSLTQSSNTANLNQYATMLVESSALSLWLTYVVENDLKLVVLGWLLVMTTAISNHLSKKRSDSKAAFRSLSFLLIKFIAYTIACVAFQLFTHWIIHEGLDFMGYPAGAITISMFFFMWNWEFQKIGDNIKEKGHEKPFIFTLMGNISSNVGKILTRMANKACGLTPPTEDNNETKDKA